MTTYQLVGRLLQIVELLNIRIKDMDAQVQALTQNVATLQTEVNQVLVAAKVIDPADEAALVAANAGLVAISGQLTSFLNPPGLTGVTGPAQPPA